MQQLGWYWLLVHIDQWQMINAVLVWPVLTVVLELCLEKKERKIDIGKEFRPAGKCCFIIKNKNMQIKIRENRQCFETLDFINVQIRILKCYCYKIYVLRFSHECTRNTRVCVRCATDACAYVPQQDGSWNSNFKSLSLLFLIQFNVAYFVGCKIEFSLYLH